MAVRKIIQIDEAKCNGCGLCVPSCIEGALQIIDGKARLVKDEYCDGLGACLGECPQDALHVIERDAPEFDEKASTEHNTISSTTTVPDPAPQRSHGGGCPGSRMMILKPVADAQNDTTVTGPAISELGQWPIQLHLVPAEAPYFKDADLLIAADCVPFAMSDFHHKFLKGKALAIACPKLDNTEPYLNKLTVILQRNHIKSVTVAHMEAPCCFGLVSLVREAVQRSGLNLPVYDATITVNGEIKRSE
jgi:Pyruvate/2-oxoacid:ferredoxin oxidoreductase delta subunit